MLAEAQAQANYVAGKPGSDLKAKNGFFTLFFFGAAPDARRGKRSNLELTVHGRAARTIRRDFRSLH